MSHDVNQDDQATIYIAEQLAAGVSSQDIIAALTLAGWTRPDAESAVAAVIISTGQIPTHSPDDTVHPRRPRSDAQPAKPITRQTCIRQIIRGSIGCAAGIAVTVITYLGATQNGGMYIIWYGLIGWGASNLLCGLYNLHQISEDPPEDPPSPHP